MRSPLACGRPAPPPPPTLQVGVEKEKVNAENAAAQVEADACAAIAAEVAELQARCEGELAAAEPLVSQAEEALNTLNKKDLGERCSSPATGRVLVAAVDEGVCPLVPRLLLLRHLLSSA